MVIESIMCNLPNFSNNSLGAISFICTKSRGLFEGGDCFECFRLGVGGAIIRGMTINGFDLRL